MAIKFLSLGLSYIFIGIILAFFYILLTKQSFQHFWLIAAVSILGTFLGGFVEFIFQDFIHQLTRISGILNIFPPLISAAILLSLLNSLYKKKDKYE